VDDFVAPDKKFTGKWPVGFHEQTGRTLCWCCDREYKDTEDLEADREFSRIHWQLHTGKKWADEP
jgi:hypothetical protein